MPRSRFEEMSSEFSKIDFKRIQEIENDISRDKRAAFAYIDDPDGYMISKLKGTHIPHGLHFHIKLKEELIPADSMVPEHQITFSSTIKFATDFAEEALQRIQARQANGPIRPFYCEGCGYCKISLV